MKTIHKAITVITLAAVLVCMASSIKAKADTIEASEVLAANVPGADLTSIAYAYNNLNDEQRLIADYLLGAYNYAYLCARGFSFNIDQTETNMKATLGAVGERIFQYMTTNYAWRSRFNEVFRQYASSIIVYASKQNVIFDTWINDILSGTRNVYIEYSDDAFDAWTEFYNDPSGDGIASFGTEVSDWYSGNFYDFEFTGNAWNSSSDETRYNSFILSYNPVLFSSAYNNGSQISQYCFDPSINGKYIDSLFILRSSNNVYSSFTYGFSDISKVTSYYRMNAVYVYKYNNKLYSNTSNPNFISSNVTITGTTLSSLIQEAFDRTPFRDNFSRYYTFYYPFITHVYLVDNLDTLSNPEEIQNIQSFNIVAPGIADFIITPNGKLLIPGYAPMTDPFAELWDVSVDIDNNPASEDDYNTQIVNNTVINNYVVDASDKINVPVNWFDNELSDKLANDSIPFLSFARDCIDTLGDLQIYFYGAIVFGLGGGVLKKLLL